MLRSGCERMTDLAPLLGQEPPFEHHTLQRDDADHHNETSQTAIQRCELWKAGVQIMGWI
jgi:hypothetical protein